jgi:ribulose-bisphosphate carboxylase large chain
MSIIEDTNEGLDWNPQKDKVGDYIFVTYSFHSDLDPKETAYFLAREQSTSTYNRLHGETVEIREARATKVYDLKKDTFVLAYPVANIRFQISELLVTINGNGNFFHSKIFSKLIVEDIKFPKIFLGNFSGPKYGKDLLGYFDTTKRPILIGVQKPSIGLPTEQHVERALEAFRGGCEIVKDDEQLYPNDPENLIEDRLKILAEKLPELRKKHRKNFMYVFNLTSDEKILEYCKLIEKYSKEKIPLFGIMVSLLLGLPFIRFVRENTLLPIFSHPSGFGLYSRGPYGFSNKALVKILRLLGVDCIIHPGVYSKIAYADEKMSKAAKDVCDEKLDIIKQSILAFGGGMRKENYKQTQKLMNGNDFVFLVGGAIFGHKNGPKTGAEDLIQFMES